MGKANISVLADSMIAAVRGAIAQSQAELMAKVDELWAFVKAMPAAQKGERGDDGADGQDADLEVVAKMIDERVALEVEKRMAAVVAKDGAPGRDGQPGAPGAAGRDGENGKDGRDGFTPDDLQLDLEGRTMTVRLVHGEAKVERAVKLPFPIYRDVYKPDTPYEKGDCVTYGGHVWMACADEATDKPGTSEQWRLAVKRGRDGKDSK